MYIPRDNFELWCIYFKFYHDLIFIYYIFNIKYYLVSQETMTFYGGFILSVLIVYKYEIENKLIVLLQF